MGTYVGATDLVKQSSQFIKKYHMKGFDVYDGQTPVRGLLPKTFNHQGETFNATLNLSMGGGRSFGNLGQPSTWKSERVSFGRKKMYYRGRVDRHALYASKAGGTVDGDLYEQMSTRCPQSFGAMVEMAMFMDYDTSGGAVVGSGKLGTATAVVNADPTFTVTMANDFRAANFEIGDVVNIETGNTDAFEVTAVDVANEAITVVRLTGVQVPLATDEVFLQNSEALSILGLNSMCDFVAGDTLYGVAHGYRFAPTRVNCAGALSVEKMEEVILGMGELTGEGPDAIFMNKAQWPSLTKLLEGDKRYDVTQPKRDIQGHLGFRSLVFVHPYGVSNVYLSRFCPAGRIYFVNTNRWELKHSMGFGWFRDSGSMWLTRQDEDELEFRYGGYGEFWGIPTYFGLLYGIT